MVSVKNFLFITVTIVAVLFSSCNVENKSDAELLLRSPSAKKKEAPANNVSLARRSELFSLTNTYLLSKSGQSLIEAIIPYELSKSELGTEEIAQISRSNRVPIEGNLIYLLEKYESFEGLLRAFSERVADGAIEKTITDFENAFKKLEDNEEIIKSNNELLAKRPHVIIDENGRGTTRYKQVFSNHAIVLDDGKVIGATDILEAKKKFIKGLEGDIWANVFDFDLLELADAFVEKVENGHQVMIGIDKSNYDNKSSVRKVVYRLRKGGVQVHLVKSDGLSHQKIIAGGMGLEGKGKVIFSSGNFTSSGIHRDGDLGELGLSHELSFPNANNFIELHDDHLALLVRHELEKTLVYKQHRTEYPLANFYRFVGGKVDGFGESLIDVAFTPNGGLGDIMSRMLAPEIENRKGKLFIAAFAYPKGPVNDAIFNRALKEIDRNGIFDFVGIGDTSFSTRPWASFIEMIGHLEEKTPTTNDTIFTPNFKSRWLKGLGREEMRKLVKNIYSAPYVYSRHEVRIDDEYHEFAAKLHHKLIVIDENTATVGNSANFSNAAVEKNHEQLIIVHDPKIAERARGIVRGLTRDAIPLISTINKRREYKINVDKKAKVLIAQILSFIDSTDVDISRAQQISGELESLIGYEKARNIILSANADRVVPVNGRNQLAFAFDLDDNVLNLETKIILYNKKSDAEKAIKTTQWRKHKRDIGVKGIFKEFEVREDSFREFNDSEKLVKDLVWAIENKPERWKGPFFDRLIEATSTKKSADLTSIVSRRGSREAIHLALKKLKDLGYIKYLPPKDNIWCLNDESFNDHYKDAFGKNVSKKAKGYDGEDLKAKVLKQILDKVNKRTASRGDSLIINSTGEQSEKITLWSYSEDDPSVFNKVQEVLQKEVDKGSWPNVKVSLYYTGPKSSDIVQDRVVLVRGVGARPITLIEEIEWINFKFGGQNSTISCGSTMKSLLSPN